MNCPQCGRFMALEIADPIIDTTIYWWVCRSDYCDRSFPAPRHDWRYCSISDDELETLRGEDPETAQAFDAMRHCYFTRGEHLSSPAK